MKQYTGIVKIEKLVKLLPNQQVIYHRGIGTIIPETIHGDNCIVEHEDGTPSSCSLDMLEIIVIEYSVPIFLTNDSETKKIQVDEKEWKNLLSFNLFNISVIFDKNMYTNRAKIISKIKEVPSKERVNYSISEGLYVGHGVNIPVVCQAKSLVELEHKLKIMAASWLKYMTQILDQEHPFEFTEEKNEK